MTYYGQAKFKTAGDKGKQIAEMVKRREQSIKTFTDKKNLSIAVSSAFNGSAEFVNTLLATGKIKPEEIWSKHKEIYEDYLTYYLEAQNNAIQEVQDAVFGKQELYNKEMDSAERDIEIGQ